MTSTSPEGETAALARFVAELRFDQLPAAVVSQACDVILDALGCAIAAWRDEVKLPNLAAPLELDVCATWPLDRADAIVCINMVHISPWESSLALFAGAARLLRHFDLMLDTLAIDADQGFAALVWRGSSP